MNILWQYNYNSSNDELYHYGVLGMKWGVRKALKGNSEYKKAKKQYNRDFNAAAKAARKTKSFAITQKGKVKKAKLDADYDDKYNRMVRSKSKVDKIRSSTKNKVIRELRAKDAKKPKFGSNEFKVKAIVNQRRVAQGIKVASEILNNVGNQRAADYLRNVSNAATVAGYAQQYEYAKNYWKN